MAARVVPKLLWAIVVLPGIPSLFVFVSCRASMMAARDVPKVLGEIVVLSGTLPPSSSLTFGGESSAVRHSPPCLLGFSFYVHFIHIHQARTVTQQFIV